MVCILGGLDHSQLEGLDSPEGEVAVEGTGVGAEAVGGEVDLAVQLLVLEDGRAHDEVRVAADVLGEAVVGDVGAEEEGRGEVGSGEGVIDHDDDVGVHCLDCGGDCLDVDQLEGRVGRGFNPQHLGFLPDRLHHVLDFGDVDKLRLEAVPLGGESSHVPLGASVDVVADDQVVALAQSVEDGGGGSAATGEGDRVFSVFNSGKAIFKGFSGGVSSSGVVEFSVGLGDVLLGVGGGEVDGDVDRSVDGFGLLSGVDGESGEAGVAEGEVVGFREGLEGYFWLLLLVEHGYNKWILFSWRKNKDQQNFYGWIIYFHGEGLGGRGGGWGRIQKGVLRISMKGCKKLQLPSYPPFLPRRSDITPSFPPNAQKTVLKHVNHYSSARFY